MTVILKKLESWFTFCFGNWESRYGQNAAIPGEHPDSALFSGLQYCPLSILKYTHREMKKADYSMMSMSTQVDKGAWGVLNWENLKCGHHPEQWAILTNFMAYSPNFYQESPWDPFLHSVYIDFTQHIIKLSDLSLHFCVLQTKSEWLESLGICFEEYGSWSRKIIYLWSQTLYICALFNYIT